MKLKVFSIFDCKVAAYMTPFFMRSTGEAERSFADAVKARKEGSIGEHPEDYTLFELGVWDDETAQIELYEAKRSLGSGNDFIEPGLPQI